MKNSILLLLLLYLFTCKIFAQTTENLPLFEKNYIQIAPLYFDYQVVNSDTKVHNEDNKQLLTSRPSILFYFNMSGFIFRSFIGIDSTLSTSEGSFAAGKLFSQTFELGLYSLLNHTENTTGTGSNEAGIIHSKFLLGPYFVLYPYTSEGQFFEINSRVTYEYRQYKTITSGATANITEQRGINLNVGLQHSIKISNKIYYAPNTNFTYFVTNDIGGGDTLRNGYEWQIIPISFQVTL